MMSMHPASGRRGRGGFSLIELGISTGLVGVLMVSLASVVVVASKALPDAEGLRESGTRSTSALDQILGDLRCATQVTEATAAAVTFTVPDRTGDLNPETIRYSWAGAGHPVLRQQNGGVLVDISGPLQQFQLSYDRRKTSTTETTTGVWNSGEILFSSFNGWTGLLSTSATLTLSSSAWGAEAFRIDKVSFPEDTSKIAITRVSVVARTTTTATGPTWSIGIHKPSTAGGTLPAATPIGTPATLLTSALTTSLAWVDATFSDVVLPDRTLNWIIVCKGSGTSSAVVRYLTVTTAVLDNYMWRSTSNSGSSWSTALDTQDMPFFVYGYYERPTSVTSTVDSYTLASVGVAMQPGATVSTRLDAGTEAFNKPGIPAP